MPEKLGKRMLLGFSVIMMLSVVLTIAAVSGVERILKGVNYVFDFPEQRLMVLNNINESFAEMRQGGLAMLLYQNEEYLLKAYNARYRQYYQDLVLDMEKYIELNREDTRKNPVLIEADIEKIKTAGKNIAAYKTQILDKSAAYIFEGNYSRAESLHKLSEASVKETYDILRGLILSERAYRDRTAAMSLEPNLVFILAAINIFSLILSLVIALIISKTVTLPLQRLGVITECLLKGDFNIPPPATASKDEIGVLTSNLFAAIGLFKSLLCSIEELAEGQQKGKKDIYINTEDLEGYYKETAALVNKIAGEQAGKSPKIIYSVRHYFVPFRRKADGQTLKKKGEV